MGSTDIVEKIVELLERVQYGDKIGRTVVKWAIIYWLAKVLIGAALISILLLIAYIQIKFLF